MGFSIYVIYHNVGSGIINYVDHQFPFDFKELLRKQLFTWNDRIYLGFDQSLSLLINLSYTIIFSFIQCFATDYVFVNRLEHILAIFFNIYFFYLFLTSLFVKKLNYIEKLLLLLSGTFFTTNVLSSALFFMGISQQVLAFSCVTLLLYGIRKYLFTKNKIFIIPIILSLFLISNFNLPYSFLAIIMVMVVIFAFNDVVLKTKFKIISLFLLFWTLTNFYWLLPLFNATFIIPTYNLITPSHSKVFFTDFVEFISSRYTFNQLFKLAPNFELIKIQNADYSMFIRYFGDSFIISLSYLAVGVTLTWHFISKRRNNNIAVNIPILILAFMVFIFLTKGGSPPFGSYYYFLVKSTTVFKMFRDPFKWLTIPLFIFAILISNILINTNYKLIKFIIIMFLVSYLFPWTYKGLMERLTAYGVPQYYFQFKEAYRHESNNSVKRAVILDSVSGYTGYKFDSNLIKGSSNILKAVSPIPIVDLFSPGGGNSFECLTVFFKNLKRDDKDIVAFRRFGATHIYHQRDLLYPNVYKYTDKYFKKVTFGKIDVYEIKEDHILPIIYAR